MVCIWFNTLDEELLVRTTAFLNCVVYYQAHLTSDLLRLGVMPIALTLLSSAADDAS